jgi:hypothetical protein
MLHARTHKHINRQTNKKINKQINNKQSTKKQSTIKITLPERRYEHGRDHDLTRFAHALHLLDKDVALLLEVCYKVTYL